MTTVVLSRTRSPDGLMEVVSESLKGLFIMVILERVKGEPSGNKVFKDFVYRNCFNYIVQIES